EIRAHHQELVGDRVEVGPEGRPHVETAGEISVDPVRDPGENEDHQRDSEAPFRDREEEEGKRREAQERDEVGESPRAREAGAPVHEPASSATTDRALSSARRKAAPEKIGLSFSVTIPQAVASLTASDTPREPAREDFPRQGIRPGAGFRIPSSRTRSFE